MVIMSKKFEKFLNDTNKELKKKGFFNHHKITIDGDFKSEYNFIYLSRDNGVFPIATVATENEAVAAITGYMTGLKHGKDNSYTRFCDKD